jgi:hypothetical protein
MRWALIAFCCYVLVLGYVCVVISSSDEKSEPLTDQDNTRENIHEDLHFFYITLHDHDQPYDYAYLFDIWNMNCHLSTGDQQNDGALIFTAEILKTGLVIQSNLCSRGGSKEKCMKLLQCLRQQTHIQQADMEPTEIILC